MVTTVFTGGTVIIDADRNRTSVTTSALAIDGGTVIAHGAEAEAMTDSAQVIDLDGGTLAPALGDGHAHPVMGGQEALGPAIRDAENLDGVIAAVADFSRAHPDIPWIVGASYDATFAPGGAFDARWLDEVTGDTPTVLRAWDYHTVWVNSAALRAGGITAETPDPPLGRIVRREDGSPMGTLQEAAANDFLATVVPPFALEQRLGAIEEATRGYAAQGTTWVQDAWVEPGDIELYLTAAQQQRLHTRVNLALRADPFRWREQLDEFVATRARIRGAAFDRLSAETVKFFVDGVIENHTAALIEPYTDRPHDSGLPNWAVAELTAAAHAFDAAGFQLHLHAIGDAANRSALDALESVIRRNPESAGRHVIAHVALLDPADIARFAELGIIANFEPFWAQCDDVMQALTIPHIGHDRESWQYLIGSVRRAGATVSFGSDWPVTTYDWRPALATAVTRHDHTEPTAEPWLPEERVSAEEALGAYTASIAAQALAPDRGTLDVGNVADLVWLTENPLTIEPTEIPGIGIRGTWLAGERVHG